MLILIESVVMCFILVMVCVIGMADGPAGSVYFYEPKVQERVVELGLITKEKLKKRALVAKLFLFASILFVTPAMVYFINGARGFFEIFIQVTIILLIQGLFDRIFIDWYWVCKTKAWYIPGTEDLMPYVPKKVLIIKWTWTIVGFPIVAAILASIMTLL